MSIEQCSVSDILRELEKLAPARLAEDWDNVGLMVGDPSAPVRRAMTCLELTEATLAEAVRREVDLIIAHHPLIFKPLRSLNFSRPVDKLLGELVRHGIALAAAHTNLDSALWGTNQVLAEACGWQPGTPLLPRNAEALYKLIVYTPAGHERAIIDAINRGGGGSIGAYSHCTFRSPGTGTFKGGADTDPFIGTPGELTEAEELRIESIVPASARRRVVREVLAAHPYEEVAYDLIALENCVQAGLGCIVELERKTPAAELGEYLKTTLKPTALRLSGKASKKIKRLAICTGSGGSFIGRAACVADALLTGEITYHHAIEAHQRGIAVFEIGHFESEVLVAGPLAKRLGSAPEIRDAGVEVIAAKKDFQPFTYL